MLDRAAKLEHDNARRAAGDPTAPIAAVYAIQHRSGRRYIGCTINLARRWANHLGALRHGHHRSAQLQADWDRDGPDAFEWQVLEADGSFEAETYWITVTPLALLYNGFLEDTHGMHRGARAACQRCTDDMHQVKQTCWVPLRERGWLDTL